MTLDNILDWIESLDIAEHYYIGKLNAKQEKSIGIYQRNNSPPLKMLGEYQTYKIKHLTLLVHWNRNPNETEQAALAVYDAISKHKNLTIWQHKVDYISMLNEEPVDISTDETGIYERVIDFDIYYEI